MPANSPIGLCRFWILLAAICFVAGMMVAGPAAARTTAAQRKAAIDRWTPPRELNRSQLARQGFRVIEGKYITLVTDLEPSEAIDELPKAVDAAVPLLVERFGLTRRFETWHVQAMLIKDREKFRAAGLMPEKGDEFPNGLSIGYEIWVMEQSSDYYRRHLLLHELVHSFMATQLGGCGPGWYMEGMAELLGTHEWDPTTGSLKLGIMPASREATPMWGRIKLIRDAVAEQRMLPVASVMKIDNKELLGVESYSWVWALAKWLDTHPRYSARFRDLQTYTLESDFDARFRRVYASDWSDLQTEWQLFIATLDYGDDIEREAIDFPQNAQQVQPLATPARLEVSATRGWQCTQLLLEAGRTYELKAGGRFVIGAEPDGTPWTCEPGGITLDYHNGQPLGQLLAAIDSRPVGNNRVPPTTAFLTPTPVGLGTKITPEQSGVLYLRLNDSPGGLDDNRGDCSVGVRRLP